MVIKGETSELEIRPVGREVHFILCFGFRISFFGVLGMEMGATQG